MIVDWKVRGHQQYNVRRGCSYEPERPCFEGAASHGQAFFKDCTVTCDSDGCNHGLDEVAKKFDSGKGQEQCLTCSYLEKSDGTVEGNDQCKDGTTSKFSKNCPTYANSGCYTGSSLHYEADDSSLALEEVYKGCSTFEPKEHSDCKGWFSTNDVVNYYTFPSSSLTTHATTPLHLITYYNSLSLILKP